MFQRMIEDFKDSTGNTLRMTSLAALAGFTFFVTLSFLFAAAFVAILQVYGSIVACLAIAGIFFLMSAITAAVYMSKKRRARARAAASARQAAKSATSSMLADPMLLAAGMQIVRAVGIKKLIPLLAIGGIALGVFANRQASSTPLADDDDNDTNAA